MTDSEQVFHTSIESQSFTSADGSTLSLSEKQITYSDSASKQESYLWEQLSAWSFEGSALELEFDDSAFWRFIGDDEQLDSLKGLFLWLKLKRQYRGLSEDRQKQITVTSCSSCGAPFLSTKLKKNYQQCPHCFSLLDGEGKSQSSSDGYLYTFCDDGEFALLSKLEAERNLTGPALAPKGFIAAAQPLLDKVISYGLWTLITLGVMGLSWLALGRDLGFDRVFSVGIYFFMALACFSVLMMGYYWSGLMLAGSARPLFFPPAWEKLNRYLRLGYLETAAAMTKELRLEEHPGFLANWAQAYARDGKLEKTREVLERAMGLCPDSPSLIHLAWHYAAEEEKSRWEQRLKDLLNASRLTV